MGQSTPVRENEIANAVKTYLWEVGGSAPIGQIRQKLGHYIELNDQDRARSTTRPSEEVWEQLVRNIVCHRESEGNAVKNGDLIYKPGRLELKDSPQSDLFG